MPVNRRTKIISIRLSDEEYDELRCLCAIRGAYSISELARAAMKVFVRQESGEQGINGGGMTIESRMNEMYERVTVLDREVARLASVIGLDRLQETQ